MDIIDDTRHGTSARQAHAGGSPLNVAVGCSKLDLPTTLVTHYDASDSYGHVIERHLLKNGVTVINGGSARTSTAAATLSADGAANYDFAITWDIIGAALAALSAVEMSTHVHTGSIATALEPGNRTTYTLVQAARKNATVSFDPNCRPAISQDHEKARQQAELFVGVSDIVKASDEDLEWLYPDRAPEESLAAWLELGPALGALTRGGNSRIITPTLGSKSAPRPSLSRTL